MLCPWRPWNRAQLSAILGLLVLVGGSSSAFAQAARPSRPPAPPAEALAAPNHPGWSVDGRTGCWIWSGRPQQNETVAWSGECDAYGRATGRGTLERRYDGKVQRFDGDVRNGTPNGRGVETFPDGVRFEGEFRDGQLNGRGVALLSSGMRYEGEFRDSQANGQGVLTLPAGGRLEGEFRGGRLNGRGVALFSNGKRYEGEFRNGRFHGRGVLKFPSGNRYEGEFRDDQANGRGVETFAEGGRYEGEWRDGQTNGHGVLTLPDGGRYEGEFRDGELNGRGVAMLSNGKRYEGEFRNGRFHGHGVLTFPNGNRYEGEFRDDQANGRGVETSPDGDRFEGEFRDGLRNGRGAATFSGGGRYEGEFRDGQLSRLGVAAKTPVDTFTHRWMSRFIYYYRWISIALGVVCLSAAFLMLAVAFTFWLAWLFCFPIQRPREWLERTGKALLIRSRVIWAVMLGCGLAAFFVPYLLIGAALFAITTWLFFRLVPENEDAQAPTSRPGGILETLWTRWNSLRTMEPPLHLITGIAVAELLVAAVLLIVYWRPSDPVTVAHSGTLQVQMDWYVFWIALSFLIVAWSFFLTGASHGGVSFLLVLAAFTYATWPSLAANRTVTPWLMVIGVWAWGSVTWWRNRAAHGADRFHWRSACLSLAFLGGWLTLYYLILYRNLTAIGPDKFHELINAQIFKSSVLLVPILFLAGTDFAEMAEVVSQSVGRVLSRLVSEDRQVETRTWWSWGIGAITAGTAAGILAGGLRWGRAEFKEGGALVTVILLALASGLVLAGMRSTNRLLDWISQRPWGLRYPTGWLLALLSFLFGVSAVVCLGLLVGVGFFEVGLILALVLALVFLMGESDSTGSRSARVPFWALALAALFFTGTHEVATLVQASYVRPFSGESVVAFTVRKDYVEHQQFSVAYPSDWHVLPLKDSRTVAFAPDGAEDWKPLFLVTKRDSSALEGFSWGEDYEHLVGHIWLFLRGTVFVRQGHREFNVHRPTGESDDRSVGGWRHREFSLMTSDQKTPLYVEVWVRSKGGTTWVLTGVAPQEHRAYYDQLFTRMVENWRDDDLAVAPEVWHEDLEKTATRVVTFGLVPVILVSIGLGLLYRNMDTVRTWLRHFRLLPSAETPDPTGSPRDMAGLFAVIAGVAGFFFLPHGKLTELFGPIQPIRHPIAELQMVVSVVTIVIVLVILIRRAPLRYATVLTQLFELNLALLLIAFVYFLYGGGFFGGSEATSLPEKTLWRATRGALFLLLALLWELASSTEITKVDGRVFRRPARVLLYAGYIMLVCTAALFVSAQTFEQSTVQPELFFEAEEVVRQGVVWLGTPLLLLTFLVHASGDSTVRTEFAHLRAATASRLRSWFV